MFSCWLIDSFILTDFKTESLPFVLQTNQKVTVHVNNEQSRNCSSSRGMNVFAVEVPARSKMVWSFPFCCLTIWLRYVLVIIIRKDDHRENVLPLYYIQIYSHVALFILNKKNTPNIISITKHIWWQIWIIWLYDILNTRMSCHVLSSRCANTFCPSTTNRTGPTTVWRLY